MTSHPDEWGSGVFIELPLPEQRLFRNRAAEDILLLLARNPHEEFMVTEVRSITGHGGDTVQTALQVLEAADLVHSRRNGRKKLVSANRDRFHRPDDPILSIPQEQFRTPVRTFLRKLEGSRTEVVGVILFGSVARGDADRTSDIDLQVIVDGELPDARRDVHDIRQDIEDRTFEGQRYELGVLVESLETAASHGERLQEIFSEGIPLVTSDELDVVREAVFGG